MKKNRKGVAGHSIIYLADELKVPEELLSGIRKISPEYLISRYPDVANVAPEHLRSESLYA